MVAALAAMGLGAAPVVEITSVQQQYPWTNTVDITYTSTGIAEDNTYYVVFKAQDSAGNEIDVITNALKVSQGSTWVAQWQPPFNVRYENCTMTPYVYKGGQDDYMVVDLETWQVTYEGMSTQGASNEKYNTTPYKTRYLVLRKVPSGDYWMGNSDISANTYHRVNFPNDYYIGIFKLTVAQYDRIASGTKSTGVTPKVNLDFNSLRGSAGSAATPSTGIFATMKTKTGLEFDCPTHSMWEVAAKAGVKDELKYPWGNTSTDADFDKYVQRVQGSAVGTKDPNGWGLYDMVGNNYEASRDTANDGNLATLQTNGLAPVSTGTASSYDLLSSQGESLSSYQHRISKKFHWSKSGGNNVTGARISYIKK